MTIEEEISQCVTMTPTEVADLSMRSYYASLQVLGYERAWERTKAFWYGVIAGAMGAFVMVLVAWEVTR